MGGGELQRDKRTIQVKSYVDTGAFLAVQRAACDLLEREGLAVLAGSVFGKGGEEFVRLSFIVEPERLREAAVRMARVLDRFGAAKGRA